MLVKVVKIVEVSGLGALLLDRVTTSLENVGTVISVLGETRADVEVLSDALGEKSTVPEVTSAIRAGRDVALLNDIEEIVFTCH
jgi:hypothetical protein